MSSHLERNRNAYGRMVNAGSPFSKVATDEECREPLKTLDGRNWLPSSVAGLEVLCLAAGGGWQSILYASAGARVTVFDLCPEMLELDAREAARRNLKVRCVEGSMDRLDMFTDQSFDIVHQPVSTCYVPDINAVYAEVSRVLRDGGLYISQHKQPTSLQIVERDSQDRYDAVTAPYYSDAPLPPIAQTNLVREPGTWEYVHRWEELLGGLCRSGFVIEDLTEPLHAKPGAEPGTFAHRSQFIAPYVRIKARRIDAATTPRPTILLS